MSLRLRAVSMRMCSGLQLRMQRLPSFGRARIWRVEGFSELLDSWLFGVRMSVIQHVDLADVYVIAKRN